MNALKPTTRFAPSPTGFLHIGNLRAALLNVYTAGALGGEMILRLEDTDRERSEERYWDALREDLAWIGVNWSRGPDCEDAQGPYRQSLRDEIYATYFSQLEASADAYPCFCSATTLKLARKAMLNRGQAPRYPGTCFKLSAQEREERLASGEAATLRFHVNDGVEIGFDDLVKGSQSFNSSDIGDFVIRRSDGTPAFFFSNAVDDSLMGVTHVVRGEDHLANTPRQLMLLEKLGLRAPLYGHVSLLTSKDGSPLSKRSGSTSIRDLKNEGYLPSAIKNYVARLGHSYDSGEVLDDEMLSSAFKLSAMSRSSAKYDTDQLLHWQKNAVHQLKADSFFLWLEGHGVIAKLAQYLPERVSADEFCCLVQANVVFPADALDWAQRLFAQPWQLDDVAHEQVVKAGGAYFSTAADLWLSDTWDFKAFTRALGVETSTKGKALFAPLRAALTGGGQGPELVAVADLVGRESVHTRLLAAQKIAGK